MPRPSRSMVLVVLVLQCGVLVPAAQAAEDPEPWVVRASREKLRAIPASPLKFARIKPGKSMRVESGPDVVEGPFERFVADTLWLGAGAGAERVPFAADSIRNVWTRGSSAGKGALIGGLVGGVLLVAASTFYVSGSEEEYEVDDSGFLGAGVLGFAGGAVIGALAGSAIPRWHRKYP